MGNLDFTISVLEEDEDVLASLNCNLKSFIDFTIVDRDGVLYKGRDLSVVHDFEYKLITSFNVKEDDYKNKYIIFKYNGDRVKITNITGGDILEVAYTMSKKQRIL